MNGGISDGFGEALTIDEQIARFDKWAHVVANSRLAPGHPDHDDLVQEARIGIWEALVKHDPALGALPSYVTRAAKWKMDDAIERRKWTGQETTRGVPRHDRDRYTDSLDALIDGGLGDLLAAAEVLESVTLAYHYGEIQQALDSLEPVQREYVYLRFWMGLSGAEIEAKTGVKPSTQLFRFKRNVVPALRARLGHLAGAL